MYLVLQYVVSVETQAYVRAHAPVTIWLHTAGFEVTLTRPLLNVITAHYINLFVIVSLKKIRRQTALDSWFYFCNYLCWITARTVFVPQSNGHQADAPCCWSYRRDRSLAASRRHSLASAERRVAALQMNDVIAHNLNINRTEWSQSISRGSNDVTSQTNIISVVNGVCFSWLKTWWCVGVWAGVVNWSSNSRRWKFQQWPQQLNLIPPSAMQ